MVAEELAELKALMLRHGVHGLEYEDPDRSLNLIQTGDQVDVVRKRKSERTEPVLEVRAPTIGLFISCHPLAADDPAFPREVVRDEIIGWLKVGAVLKPVMAPADGLIGAPLVAEGELVGYGDRLF